MGNRLLNWVNAGRSASDFENVDHFIDRGRDGKPIGPSQFNSRGRELFKQYFGRPVSVGTELSDPHGEQGLEKLALEVARVAKESNRYESSRDNGLG